MTDANRYPLEPLAVKLKIELGQLGGQRDDETTGLARLALRLGISHEAARNARKRGLNDRQADRFAVRCGWHPVQVWPEWFNGVGEHIPGTCDCRPGTRKRGSICDTCGRLWRKRRKVTTTRAMAA